LLASALVALSAACTFPPYVIGLGTAGAGGLAAGAGGSAGAGAASGAGGSPGGAGSAGSGGSQGDAGAAGEGSDDPGIVLGWNSGALAQLDFALLGAAALDPDGVALTRKDVKNMIGGLVKKQQLDLSVDSSLRIALGFRITPGAMNGDGLALVLHASSDGPTRLGSGGGGLGYGGISPCLAIEIDTAEIAAADLPAPHLGLMPGCNPDDHGPSTTALGGNPSDGTDWSLEASWSSATGLLDVTLRNETTGRETKLSEPMDLLSLVGTRLFVGVMAANGEFHATHLVRRLHLAGGGIEPFTLTN
jgi:hypothetical protein